MIDRKRRLFRLIETYMNEFHRDAVDTMYGKGSKIRVHTMSHSITNSSILFELVVELGETINEDVLDKSLAHVLIKEASVYFFPEQHIKTIIRYDV